MILDGRAIETAWWGPPPSEAPTLVLLHEGLGSVGLWRDTPAALAEATGCGVFAYSRFGYGRSAPCALPRPLRYMHDEALDVLPRVLDAAGIGRCILVGHSDGGSIAAIHAGTVHDPRVAGIVLIAAHFFVEGSNLASIRAIRETYATTDFSARMARHHDHPDVAFRGWNDAWLDPGFSGALELSAELTGIAVPTLLIQGDDDPYGTEAQLRMAERLAGGPVDTVLVAGARHAPHLEQPAPTRGAIAEFAIRIVRPPARASTPAAGHAL